MRGLGNNSLKNLSVYSFSHFVVDFICAFVVLSIPRFHQVDNAKMLFFIVLYGLIAFGTQFIFGEFCDRLKKPKIFALVGISLNLISIFILPTFPLFATIITGIGNALFHIGGGVISLNLGKRKATIPGIFVSTGAMGVFLGVFFSLNYSISLAYPSILAIVVIILIFITKLPKLEFEKTESNKKNKLIILICFFILLSIFIRSFIGFMVEFPWKIGFTLGFIFTLGVVFGKAFGGILADKFGFEKVGISSLIISSILLGFGATNPILGILGIFLFNMTMPITLVVISNSLKGRPGFAFGLTTLALIIGALPYYANFEIANNLFIFMIILSSVFAIWLGLYFYKKLFKI